jgi:hypothetical protein
MTTIENRRSPRILKRVPLRLMPEGAPVHEAYTAVINVHGALVVSPISCSDGSVIEIENKNSGALARARVIWCGVREEGTGFKLGLEFLENPDFWGEDYDSEGEQVVERKID